MRDIRKRCRIAAQTSVCAILCSRVYCLPQFGVLSAFNPIRQPCDAATTDTTRPHICHNDCPASPSCPYPALTRVGSLLTGEEGFPVAGGKFAPRPCSPHVLIPADAEAAIGMGTAMLPSGKAVGLLGTYPFFPGLVDASGREVRCQRPDAAVAAVSCFWGRGWLALLF